MSANDGPEASSSTAVDPGPAADELEPQLKYERLGADVKDILQSASATCLCLSEKVLALGTSAGNIHVLDYSGNEVKKFNLHSKPVKHISFDDKAEYCASCCGDNYISVSSLYSDETAKFTFKRPITVVALEPRYASRKTREFVTGDVRGRLKLSSQGWLGRSDHVLHQGEGSICAVAWHGSSLVWVNEVGLKAYDTNMHQFVGSIKRPKGGRFADCCAARLYVHEADGGAERIYVAWPDCIKVADVLTHVDAASGGVSKALRVSASIPMDTFCMGVVPHGHDLAVLVYVTDTDPDQDQVTAEGDNTNNSSSKQQQQSAPSPQPDANQQQQLAGGSLDGSAAAGGSDPEAKQQQQQQQPEGAAVSEGEGQPSAPTAAAAAAAAINIPQPVKRPPRAANAFVRSPSGPSYLQAAAAAAAAGTAAATAAAAPADGSSGPSPASTPRPTAAGGSSAGSSPEVNKGRLAAAEGGGEPGTAAAAAAAAAAAGGGGGGSGVVSPVRGGGRPPLPSYSRSSSVASRASVRSTEGHTAPYIPPGNPLRPELRILTLSHFSEAGHTHPHSSTPSAAGTSQMQQEQCCQEVASDALSVKGYEHYLPSDYTLVPSYGNEFALLSGGAAAAAADGGGGGPQQPSTRVAGSLEQQPKGSSGSSKRGTAASDGAAAAAAVAAGGGSSAVQQQEPAAAVQADGAAAAAAATEGGGGDEAAAPAAAAAAGDGDGNDGVDDSVATPTAAVAGGGGVEGLEDFREFMFFIVSPQDIVIGRHRDVEDRISWCLSVGRYEAALALAEADRTTPPQTRDTVVQAYLESLTSAGRWSDAASQLPRLLKDSPAAWERWLFTFAQARQLVLLAPVLPVKDPLLPRQAYDLVLQALLVDPSHHTQLLSLVSTWPHTIFHPTQLIDTIAQRMQRPGGESRALWRVLALLYKGQGRPDLSLAIYLQLQLPSVFDFIQDHGLLLYLDRNAYLLMAIDERRALELLAAHLDTLPPGAVVPGLLDALAVCESKGDEAERETWRHRLFNYLDKIFTVEPSAVADYAELCVHLYADYCPARLMDFLQGSQTYPLEAALEVAQQRGLVDEQVYVLSRMGNSRAALRLIIAEQQDIPRAIEFVRLQRDEELWEELIDWALGSADTTGQLLDHIGGNINPLRVIQKIPEGLAIHKLRDRLRAIISDFRTQTSLREGCNAILRSDCIHLVQRLQREVKRALPSVWLQRSHTHASTAAAAAATAAAADGGKDGAAATAAAAAGGAKPAAAKAAAAVAVTAVAAGGGYLPRIAAGKGPQWLRYQCGSGHVMQVVSSQDVPAVAVHALESLSSAAAAAAAPAAAAAAAAGLVSPGLAARPLAGLAAGVQAPYSSFGGGSSSIPPGLPQPSRLWIGRTGTASEAALSAALGAEGVAGEAGGQQQQEEEGSARGSSSTAASRRASRQQWQRSSGVTNLPSLVAA